MKTRPYLIPALASLILFVGALGNWPHAYYVTLRIVVCVAALIMFYYAGKVLDSDHVHPGSLGWRIMPGITFLDSELFCNILVYGFLIIAVVFNPLIPLHLGRSVWLFVDALTMFFFVFALLIFELPLSSKSLHRSSLMYWLLTHDLPFTTTLMYELGFRYACMKEDQRGMTLILKAANRGYAGAQLYLAQYYYRTAKTNDDYLNAFELYLLASRNNNATAMYMLGEMYYEGKGVDQNYQKAMQYFLKAMTIDRGCVGIDVPKMIADMYYDGRGVEQNYSEAAKWYELYLHDVLDVDTIKRYAEMYAKGIGVEKDDGKANELIKKITRC